MEVESINEEKTLMPNAAQGADLRRRRRKKISMWAVGIVVVLAIIITILASTVFKPKRPVTTFNSISLKNVNPSFDLKKLRFKVNATLVIDLSINNPNIVGLKYSQSVAYLRYKDHDVGEAPIVGGEIRSKETKPMNLAMELLADRLLFDSDVYSQAYSGSLPLSTYVEIMGEIQMLFKVKVKTYSTCTFNVDVMKQSLSDFSCNYKTEM
ncbi:hypothetical protein LIER_39173 [Lithospermum erythrorhizon]|uniref:Late embryogenesis abundant protein LEA-2 subgroup domain-containing protein n=1 Tax=Lithospermum erythrorhizon TaxID=34254 RepID=A0AAV3QG38_LITER